MPHLDESVLGLVRDKATGMSKGGMASKLEAARIATTAGENVIIAGGKQPGNLRRILEGETVGTLFRRSWPGRGLVEAWIGFTARPQDLLIVDDGGGARSNRRVKACWPSALVGVDGTFKKGKSWRFTMPAARNLPVD